MDGGCGGRPARCCPGCARAQRVPRLTLLRAQEPPGVASGALHRSATPPRDVLSPLRAASPAQQAAAPAGQASVPPAQRPQSLSPHPPPPPADAGPPSRDHSPDGGGGEQPAQHGLPPSALGNLLDSVCAAGPRAVLCREQRGCARAAQGKRARGRRCRARAARSTLGVRRARSA